LPASLTVGTALRPTAGGGPGTAPDLVTARSNRMAAKLARLIYRILRYGMKYVDQGSEFYETQHRKQQVIHLKRKAAQLGLQIIEVAAAP
jgi:hypothetical protein